MKNETRIVFNSSHIENFRAIIPNVSTHNENWVYATTTIEMSAVFLSGKGGDLTCQVGRDPLTNKVFICERFKNSFEYRYNNTSGSIYLLPGDKFIKDKTGWDEEVVCSEKVDIIQEIKISNVKSYLLNLIKNDRILLVKFPNKTANIPSDDEDLVYRGITWTRQFGDDVLDDFKKLHPNLLDRIKIGLAEGKYLDDKFNE